MNTPVRFLVRGSICALMSLGCVLSYGYLGSTVDAQGVLHESFALIPLAWLFFVAAIYFGVWSWRATRAVNQKER